MQISLIWKKFLFRKKREKVSAYSGRWQHRSDRKRKFHLAGEIVLASTPSSGQNLTYFLRFQFKTNNFFADSRCFIYQNEQLFAQFCQHFKNNFNFFCRAALNLQLRKLFTTGMDIERCSEFLSSWSHFLYMFWLVWSSKG